MKLRLSIEDFDKGLEELSKKYLILAPLPKYIWSILFMAFISQALKNTNLSLVSSEAALYSSSVK